MNDKVLQRLIPDSEKPDKGVYVLSNGQIALWDAEILAWRVTGVHGFFPDWRKVVAYHGKFQERIK